MPITTYSYSRNARFTPKLSTLGVNSSQIGGFVKENSPQVGKYIILNVPLGVSSISHRDLLIPATDTTEETAGFKKPLKNCEHGGLNFSYTTRSFK